MRGYLFKTEWKDEPGRPVPEDRIRRALRKHLPAGRGPWRRRWIRDGLVVEDWGPFKKRREFMGPVLGQLRDRPAGDVMQIENDRGRSYRLRITRLQPELDGGRIVQAIRAMFGAPYVFGAENPPGDAGGPGAAFDCSGLVDWAHNTVGVDLPHGSELIRRDPRVRLFQDQRLCKPGDLVIMHFGRLPAGVADHIGVWKEPGLMLDTRSPFDPVGRSEIETWAVMAYGRIESVNGRL